MTIAGRALNSKSRPFNGATDTLPSGRQFTGFLRAIRDKDYRVIKDVYESRYVSKAAMGETSGTVGGYIVPPQYTTRLMNVISENSFILQRANVVPMVDGVECRAPRVDVETNQTTGTSPLFGGINFKWGFSQAPAETEPTFRLTTLTAWDLIGYAVVSNDWLMDAGEEGDEFLIRLLGTAAAWAAEYAFLQGLGADQSMPLGVVKAPATVTVTRAVASQIAAADVAGMAAKLLPYSWTNAVWACNPSCLAQIGKISTYIVNGDYGFAYGMGNAGFLMSRPLFVTDKLPPLGALGDLILFDPSLYAVGMRQEVVIDLSTLGPAFPTNQTDLRCWLRCDGKPQVSGPIRIADGTTTVSPYVALN